MSNFIHEIFDEIHYRYLNVYHSVKNFFRGIKSVFVWMPVTYRDRFWDENYFWLILKFKLEQMEKGHRLDGNLECSLETAKGIKECLVIVDRLAGDHYYTDGTWEDKQKDLDKLFSLMREKVQNWSD